MRDNKISWKIARKLELEELEAPNKSKMSEAEEAAIERKLEALDSLFAESKKCPEVFHELYIKPLLDEGVSQDTAFDLLVAGAIGAN